MEQYTTEWNAALAAELEALDAGYTAIPTAIIHYAKLRDRIRACNEEKDKL